MNTGRALGIAMVAIGAGGFLMAALWAGTSHAAGDLTGAAMALALGIAFIVTAPVVGAGSFLIARGRHEAKIRAQTQKMRKLLGLVQAQGQASIADIALELDASRDQVKAWIYDLVDKGLFAGYTDWQKGTLYSRDAAQLRGDTCPNCGGALTLAGKGTIKCPYCGAEIFLTG